MPYTSICSHIIFLLHILHHIGSHFWFSFPYRPTEGSLDDISFSLDKISSENNASVVVVPSPDISPRLTGGLSFSEPVTPNGYHILVVDDSPTIVKATERALRQKGFRITTANNGSAGLDLLTKGYAMKEFDLVLMDLQVS